MKPIELDGRVVAIFHRADAWKEGLDFLTPNETFIQAGTWWYPAGKDLRSHRHITNPREALRTEETIVIQSGRLRVDLYDKKNQLFHSEELAAGDIGVILEVGHGYRVLEDNTRVVEVKNGPFTSVEADKEFIPPRG